MRTAFVATVLQAAFKAAMSALLESVEWKNKDVKQMWSSQDFKQLLRVLKASTGFFYQAAAFLCNFQVFLGYYRPWR